MTALPLNDSREPRTFTEQARRAQLLKAAIDTVNEVGYPHASLAAIAQRASVAKSAIAYYFTSKDALLMHLVDHVFGELYALLEQAVSAKADPQAQLRAYAETYLDYVDSHRAEITAGVEILVSHRTPEGIPLYLTGTEEDSALLRGILETGMRQGVFRRMQMRTAVSLVESLLDLSSTELQRDLTSDLGELKQEIITVLLRGLEPR